MFSKVFWELSMIVALYSGGAITYYIATKNRGSFADTPDWSKVIRRIIEFASVFLAVVFIIFQGWNRPGVSRTILLTASIGGVVVGICSFFLVRWEKERMDQESNSAEANRTDKKANRKKVGDRLYEHLVNAIILTLFFASFLVILMLTAAKLLEQERIVDFSIGMATVTLSLELAALLYHILRLLIVENLPSKEIAQVLKIFKGLDE